MATSARAEARAKDSCQIFERARADSVSSDHCPIVDQSCQVFESAVL